MIHQRHRQTDRQMTCDRKTTLCTIVHRAVKTGIGGMRDDCLVGMIAVRSCLRLYLKLFTQGTAQQLKDSSFQIFAALTETSMNQPKMAFKMHVLVYGLLNVQSNCKQRSSKWLQVELRTGNRTGRRRPMLPVIHGDPRTLGHVLLTSR